MNRKDRLMNVLIAMVSGLTGAAIAMGVLHGLGGALVPPAEAAVKSSRTISAERFVLVDRNGARKGEFSLTSRAEPRLDLYGSNGSLRAEVSVIHDIARVRVFDSSGVPQGTLGTTPDGRVGLALLDKAHRVRETMDVASSGEPTLRLFSGTGSRLGLDVTTDGRPGLALLGPEGKTRAALVVNESGAGGLTFYNSDGSVQAGMP